MQIGGLHRAAQRNLMGAVARFLVSRRLVKKGMIVIHVVRNQQLAVGNEYAGTRRGFRQCNARQIVIVGGVVGIGRYIYGVAPPPRFRFVSHLHEKAIGIGINELCQKVA
jgi:hypothetical protein